jgi:multiple sugar transport system substrate-binding protein
MSRDPESSAPGGLTRREFTKAGVVGLASLGISSVGLGSLAELAHAHHPEKSYNPGLAPPRITPEKGASLRVLRWSGFVKTDQELWDQNTKKWEEQTGSKVLLEYLSWEDVRPKSAMTAAVGAGPDIVVGWYDDPHLYPDKLHDMTEIAEYLGKKYGGWYDVMRQYGYSTRLKRWLALPIGAPAIQINYRVSWVKEAGWEKPPAKTDEFLKLCKKLKANNHPVGFALGHAVGDGNSWTHWCLWAFGGKAVEKDNKTIAINRPETVNALEYAKELYETMIPGTASWLDPHNNKAFLAGEISITNNGISIYYAAKAQFPTIAEDTDHVPFPVGPVGRPMEVGLISQAMVFKHSKFPNAAKHYLMFMLEEPQYAPWIDATRGYVTQSLKYYSHLDVWTRDPKHTPFRDAALRMVPLSYAGTPSPQSAAALGEYIVLDMFADVCTGRKTPKEAARAAEERLARIFKK